MLLIWFFSFLFSKLNTLLLFAAVPASFVCHFNSTLNEGYRRMFQILRLCTYEASRDIFIAYNRFSLGIVFKTLTFKNRSGWTDVWHMKRQLSYLKTFLLFYSPSILCPKHIKGYELGLQRKVLIKRAPQCISPRRNWDSPNPSSASECALPPGPKGGTRHTRLRLNGWGSPNSNDWRKSLALCLLCGLQDICTLRLD
jgi:hypothetical protein